MRKRAYRLIDAAAIWHRLEAVSRSHKLLRKLFRRSRVLKIARDIRNDSRYIT